MYVLISVAGFWFSVFDLGLCASRSGADQECGHERGAADRGGGAREERHGQIQHGKGHRQLHQEGWDQSYLGDMGSVVVKTVLGSHFWGLVNSPPF